MEETTRFGLRPEFLAEIDLASPYSLTRTTASCAFSLSVRGCVFNVGLDPSQWMPIGHGFLSFKQIIFQTNSLSPMD